MMSQFTKKASIEQQYSCSQIVAGTIEASIEGNTKTALSCIPSVALESAVMVPELMKKPRPLLSAVPTVTGLSLTVNGF